MVEGLRKEEERWVSLEEGLMEKEEVVGDGEAVEAYGHVSFEEAEVAAAAAAVEIAMERLSL